MADIVKPTPGSVGWSDKVDALFDDHNANPLTDGTIDNNLTNRLAAIATHLDPAASGVLAVDGAGWLRKSYSALKTALALVKGDVGLGNVDNTADADKPVSTPQATSISARVAKTGDTMTGRLQPYDLLEGVKFDSVSSLTNKAYPGTMPTALAQAPFGNLWHDLLAFNRTDTPDFETSADGTTFVAGTLDNNLFCSKDGLTGSPVINGTTMVAQRWTWNSSGFAFSTGTWLVIGFRYDGGTDANKRILFESSSDGTNWTTRHTSTTTIDSAPMWFYVSTYGGDTYLRLTITWLSGGLVPISTIRLLSPRWGDQGNGAELALPYTWDKDRNIGIGLGFTTTIDERLHVNGNAKISGQLYGWTSPTGFVNNADYTLALTDPGRIIDMNSASAQTVTVPTNASVAIPNGSHIIIRRMGAGTVTIAPAGGVNIRTGAGLTIAARYGEVRLIKRASDEWVLSGDVTPLLPDVQVFTSSGTWTKPAGATVVRVEMISAGGGGGSGPRRASGTATCGGNSGHGGGYSSATFRASDLGSTEAVTVGAAGTGGAAVTADDTNGNTGTGAAPTIFGSQKVRANGGGGGGGGGTSVQSNGASGAGTNGGAGAVNGVIGGAGNAGNRGATMGGSGGSGGGISTTPAHFAGGPGGVCLANADSAATAGTAGGGTGANGFSAPSAAALFGGGGGGGGGSNISGAGGAGGNGGTYGASGGGGGASLNGSNSGKGGDGAPGIVIVVST